jgi:hypothetical protein
VLTTIIAKANEKKPKNGLSNGGISLVVETSCSRDEFHSFLQFLYCGNLRGAKLTARHTDLKYANFEINLK